MNANKHKIKLLNRVGWGELSEPQQEGYKSFASIRVHSRLNLVRKQRGISIIIVVFLLAVVSLLTVSIMNLTGTQHINTMYAARGAQGYYAARAGAEVAVAIIADPPGSSGNCGNVTAASPLAIQGFTVTLGCAVAGPFDEGDPAAPYSIYTLTSSASAGDFTVPDAVNRVISVTVIP
jgi:hypothetical protein